LQPFLVTIANREDGLGEPAITANPGRTGGIADAMIVVRSIRVGRTISRRNDEEERNTGERESRIPQREVRKMDQSVSPLRKVRTSMSFMKITWNTSPPPNVLAEKTMRNDHGSFSEK
jgi:hypothetical protein